MLQAQFHILLNAPPELHKLSCLIEKRDHEDGVDGVKSAHEGRVVSPRTTGSGLSRLQQSPCEILARIHNVSKVVRQYQAMGSLAKVSIKGFSRRLPSKASLKGFP